MCRISVLLATVVICVWATPGWGAHGWTTGNQDGLQPVAASPGYEASYSGCGCGEADNGYGCQDVCGRRGCKHRLAAKKAAVGQFNCQCRGSYKYPVPPQYTYHWPGMYSQQTMTEYNSPYRFPALELPDEVFGNEIEPPYADGTAGPPAEPTRARLSGEPQELPNSGGPQRAPGRPLTTSQQMKRHYRVP